jgi:hypothetical protein
VHGSKGESATVTEADNSEVVQVVGFFTDLSVVAVATSLSSKSLSLLKVILPS